MVRVIELIDRDLMVWKKDLVKRKFLSHDIDTILQIHLSIRHAHDKLICHFNRNGVYSVRSAYHLACSRRLMNMEGTSFIEENAWN